MGLSDGYEKTVQLSSMEGQAFALDQIIKLLEIERSRGHKTMDTKAFIRMLRHMHSECETQRNAAVNEMRRFGEEVRKSGGISEFLDKVTEFILKDPPQTPYERIHRPRRLR